MTTTTDLVAAWSAWERWTVANRKARYGRRPNAGQPEAAALMRAKLAITPDHMGVHDAVAEGRRAGLTVEQAVAQAMSDNGSSLHSPFQASDRR